MWKVILVIFTLATSAATRYSSTTAFDRPYGDWTDYITSSGNDWVPGYPSLYFLCGIQFRQGVFTWWQKILFWRKAHRYHEMTTSINLMFCSSKNWDLQVKRTF